MGLWTKLRARWGTEGQVDDVRQDAVTGSLLGIDHPHHEVHEGDHYTYSAYDDDIDTNEVLEVILVTPDSAEWAHLLALASGALSTQVDFYEGTTHGRGAVATARNNNRNSTNTPGVKLYANAGGGADGTLIFSTRFGVDTGGGANRRFGGGESRGDAEWVLKQDTAYLIRITSKTNSNVVSLVLSWYEHESVN